MHIFNITTEFFVLPNLKSFDGIIGFQNFKLNFKNKILKTSSGSEIIQFKKCASVNFTEVENIKVPQEIDNEFEKNA